MEDSKRYMPSNHSNQSRRKTENDQSQDSKRYIPSNYSSQSQRKTENDQSQDSKRYIPSNYSSQSRRKTENDQSQDSKRYIPSNHSSQSRRKTENDQSQDSSGYTFSSSIYTVETPTSNFQTPFTTDIASDMTGLDIASYNKSDGTSVRSSQSYPTEHSPKSSQSYPAEHSPKESIRLMPVKVKDIMNMFKSNSAYRDKSPVMVNMKENDIDQIMDHKRSGNGIKLYSSPKQSLTISPRGSPESVRQSAVENSKVSGRSLAQASNPSSFNEELLSQSSNQKPRSSIPPLGAGQAQQVYAMTDIQAYPMLGSPGFRAHKSRRRSPRVRSPRVRSMRRSRSGRVVRRPRRRRRTRSRRRSRPRSRGRSIRRRSRPRRRSPVVVVKRRRRYPYPCTPFPLCDNECTRMTRPVYPAPMYSSPGLGYSRRPSRGLIPMYSSTSLAYTGRPVPMYSSTRLGYGTSRPVIRPSHVAITCECNLCMEKLQFIQPGVCSKKKYMWTNEYAIIPKPQVNLIDPCQELDSSIYPRADNPCIRDGRGNPLTDCIGRPLRDPIGKKFLNFSANGSVMDTNFRGNFYTGQPPLCVKCPMPGNTCAPDGTHNWWMNCGYPIRPNMNPFMKYVVATEHHNSKR